MRDDILSSEYRDIILLSTRFLLIKGLGLLRAEAGNAFVDYLAIVTFFGLV